MIYQTQAEDGIHFVYPLIQKDHKIILAHTFEVKLLKQNWKILPLDADNGIH